MWLSNLLCKRLFVYYTDCPLIWRAFGYLMWNGFQRHWLKITHVFAFLTERQIDSVINKGLFVQIYLVLIAPNFNNKWKRSYWGREEWVTPIDHTFWRVPPWWTYIHNVLSQLIGKDMNKTIWSTKQQNRNKNIC